MPILPRRQRHHFYRFLDIRGRLHTAFHRPGLIDIVGFKTAA